MSSEKATERTIPPYISYRTLRSFIESLKKGIPSRIDKTISPISTMSGSLRSQLFQAIRYLRLVGAENSPSEALKDLVAVWDDDASRQTELRKVLESAYGFIFGEQAAGFNLETATSGMLQGKFKETGAAGETVPKCISFFLAAARDANIKFSQHIATRKRMTRISEQKPKRSRETRPPLGAEETEKHPVRAEKHDHPKSWNELVLDKLPNFNPEWPEDFKKAWIDTIGELMRLQKDAAQEDESE